MIMLESVFAIGRRLNLHEPDTATFYAIFIPKYVPFLLFPFT